MSAPARFYLRDGPITDQDRAAMLATARRAFSPVGQERNGVTGYMAPATPLIYLSGVLPPQLVPHLRQRQDLGVLAQPATVSFANRVGGRLAYDNGAFGAFSQGTTFDFEAWRRGLRKLKPTQTLFAVVPDVVGDAKGTWALAQQLVGEVRSYGLPAAYVAQNGLTAESCPWDYVDALFIGGDDNWKLGPEVRELVTAARAQGKWVHMGRVNTESRLRYARDIGCSSVDGTMLRFGPKVNMPRLLNWLNQLNADRDGELISIDSQRVDGSRIVPKVRPDKGATTAPPAATDAPTLFDLP